MKHKWHKEIKCFIDGGEVERKNINANEWLLIKDIGEFSIDYMDYRIKPQPKEPQYLYVYRIAGQHNVEFRFWDTKTNAPTYVGKIKLEVDDD
jgi:hypothetical protein